MLATWNRKEGADAPVVDDTVTGVMKPEGDGHKFSLDAKEGTEYLIKSVKEGELWTHKNPEYGRFQAYVCEFASLEGFEPADKPTENAVPLGRAKEDDPTRNSIERQTALKVAGEITAAMLATGLLSSGQVEDMLRQLTDEGAKAIQA